MSFQQLSADWHADFEDSHKADGLILLGYGDYLESQSKLQQLVAQRTHFVRWGAALPGEGRHCAILAVTTLYRALADYLLAP